MASGKRHAAKPPSGHTGHQKELKERDARIKELEERMRYLQADFENYRKGLDRQRSELEARASESIITDLLCVLDDLQHAISRSGSERKHLEAVHSRIMGALEKRGLRPIEARGRMFDHYYHEAVMSRKSDKKEGTILEEFQRGFMLNSRVIRHSKVSVARA